MSAVRAASVARRLGRAMAGLAAIHVAACTAPAPASLVDAPTEVREIRVRAQADLLESSAAVASEGQAGVVFTINDSGHPPELFALDTAGRDRGTWRVVNATNRDWEAIAPAPCAPGTPGTPGTPAPTPRCLIIADTGDNDEQRPGTTLFRVVEPLALKPSARDTLVAQRLDLTYEEGARDVEAVYAGPRGDLFLITKRMQRRADGTLRPALLLRVDAAAWEGTSAVARVVDSLPIVLGSARGRSITDAARSPDGHFVAVRTYEEAYVFEADTLTGAIRSAVAPARCDLSRVSRGYGEGVSWLPGHRLLLTEEGRDAPLQVVRCPLPGQAKR